MINDEQQSRQGVIFALGAYLMWGIAPIYFKALHSVFPIEIISHRVIWSFRIWEDYLLTGNGRFGTS